MHITSIKDEAIQQEEEEVLNDKEIMIEEEENETDVLCFGISNDTFVTLWLCVMSIIHWLNVLTTPIAMIWPETF